MNLIDVFFTLLGLLAVVAVSGFIIICGLYIFCAIRIMYRSFKQTMDEKKIEEKENDD